MVEKQDVRARAKVFWEGGLKTRSLIRGFEIETDKPKLNFGTNTAPAPMEVFISSIGACLLSTFVWASLMSRVKIQDCVVDIKAYTKGHEHKERLLKIKLILTVWAEKKYKKKLEQCFDISRKNCSLTEVISCSFESIMQFKEEK